MAKPVSCREDGFTLVEVAVALIILCLSLGAMYKLFSSGLTAVERIEAVHTAVSIAQSLLDRVGSELPVKPGRTVGQLAGGLRWQISIEPYSDAKQGASSPEARGGLENSDRGISGFPA
jgi:general secretion pathway protein I